jgi:hypothetical protein
MGDISFTTGGVPGTVRPSGVFEALIGEPVTLPWGVTFVDGVAGGFTITGNTLAFSTTGRRRFRSLDGMTEVSICACESTALARLPHGQRTGCGSCDRRMILRTIVQYAPWPFDGMAAQLDSRPLAQFGGW